jgi:RNA polymerase sigma-70 factor, ECF subfamily
VRIWFSCGFPQRGIAQGQQASALIVVVDHGYLRTAQAVGWLSRGKSPSATPWFERLAGRWFPLPCPASCATTRVDRHRDSRISHRPVGTGEGGERVKILDRPARTSARAPDDALIRSLYTDHGRSLLAYAIRMTGDRHAAEDLVQDTIIKAWKNADTLFSGTRSVRAWLLAVLRNLIIDRARARAARPTEVAESPWDGPIQRDHAEDVVDSMVVLRALEALPPHHRDVLVELYYRGRTATDAADVLGIPVGTVRSHSFHALRSLRGLVRSDNPAVEGVA